MVDCEIPLGGQAAHHLRNGRRRVPKPFGQAGLSNDDALFVQLQNGLEVFLEGRMLAHGASILVRYA
jgi:hypothetical protein